MTLPTFLGIGAPRCGSTWLHELLSSHPDIYMPRYLKEIRFFDMNYERGLQWYTQFFPPDAQAGEYQAIGEFSPYYLYCPRSPERIAGMPSITKLILILRNPVERVFSHYGYRVRVENFSGTFQNFLSERPEVIQEGFYSQKLKNYLRYFEKNCILVLIFEYTVLDVPKTKDTLGRFLAVEADRFPQSVGFKRINRSYIPKARHVSAMASTTARTLRKMKFHRFVHWLNRSGIKRLLIGEFGRLPPMKDESRAYLGEIYRNEIEELESLLQMELEGWR